MKKIAKKTLIKTINGSIALLASFGLVFGLAFADKTSPFLDFNHPKKTLSYYAATPQKTI
jgi:hypothetical protein